MNDMMKEVIGEVEVELDGRFSSIRTKETNLGKRSCKFYEACNLNFVIRDVTLIFCSI